MDYIPALLLGLLGSFHCMGMCGPIAIALPLKEGSRAAAILSGVLYNLGRTITYALLGALFGLIGKGLFLGGLQQWISIILGAVMVLSVLFPLLFRNVFKSPAVVEQIVGGLKKAFGKMFSIRSYLSLFTIGILNGFLPCGLVYIALAGAIITGSLTEGAIYLAVFGLGTIPVMLLLNLAGNIISVRFRNKVRRIIPYLIVLVGILFILRGMNLGIKYVSPKISKQEPTKMECCH